MFDMKSLRNSVDKPLRDGMQNTKYADVGELD